MVSIRAVELSLILKLFCSSKSSALSNVMAAIQCVGHSFQKIVLFCRYKFCWKCPFICRTRRPKVLTVVFMGLQGIHAGRDWGLCGPLNIKCELFVYLQASIQLRKQLLVFKRFFNQCTPASKRMKPPS